MIEIRGKKGKTTEAAGEAGGKCTGAGRAEAVLGFQCFSTEPGAAWLTGAAEEESTPVTQYSPTQPFFSGNKASLPAGPGAH